MSVKRIALSLVLLLSFMLILLFPKDDINRVYAELENWSDYLEEYSGDGSEENPYIIDSAKKLAKVSYDVAKVYQCSQNKIYVLSNNIDLSGKLWTSIGNIDYPFFGKFLNGGDYSISNLKVASLDNTGLFGHVEYANVDGIKVVDASCKGNMRCSGIVGYALSSTISNCYFSGIITSTSNKIGGICASANKSTIVDCSVNATISGANYVGGIVGEAKNTNILNCISNGQISAENYVGGICGCFYSTEMKYISSCENNATICAEKHVGGISGIANYFNNQLYNQIIEISFCKNNGNLTANNGFAGGIISKGYRNLNVFSCLNCATIIGNERIGGIIGENNGAVTESINLGNINKKQSANSIYYGGIAGANFGKIEYAISKCNINGNIYSGGIVGSNSGIIKNSYFIGNVNGYSENIVSGNSLNNDFIKNVYYYSEYKIDDKHYKTKIELLNLKTNLFDDEKFLLVDYDEKTGIATYPIIKSLQNKVEFSTFQEQVCYVRFVIGNEQSETEEYCLFNQKINIPNFEKTGFVLGDFKIGSFDGETFNINENITNNMVLYADWYVDAPSINLQAKKLQEKYRNGDIQLNVEIKNYSSEIKYSYEWYKVINNSIDMEVKQNIEGKSATLSQISESGNYKVKVTATKQNCSAFTFSNEIEISILPINLSDNECEIFLSTNEIIYSGKSQFPDYRVFYCDVEIFENVDYNVVISDSINAGIGKIEFLGTGNYTGKISFKYEIKPKTLAVTWNGKEEYTYSKTKVKISATTSEKELYVNELYSDVGEYVAIADFVSPDNNYVIDTNTYKFSYKILPKVINLNVANNQTFEYNGQMQNIKYSFSDYCQSDNLNEKVTYSKPFKNVGVYSVNIKINNPNYKLCGPTNLSCKIIQKQIEVVWQNKKEFNYDGKTHTLNIERFVGISGEMIKTNVSESGTNVGEYLISVSVIDNENYTISNNINKLIIKPKVINIIEKETCFVYDGTNKIPLLDFEGIVGEDILHEEISTTKNAIEIGLHIFKIKINNSNYVLDKNFIKVEIIADIPILQSNDSIYDETQDDFSSIENDKIFYNNQGTNNDFEYIKDKNESIISIEFIFAVFLLSANVVVWTILVCKHKIK